MALNKTANGAFARQNIFASDVKVCFP